MTRPSLAALKAKLVESQRFPEIQEFFLTHFAEDDEFLSKGRRGSHATLEAVLKEVSRQLCQGSAVITDLLLAEVEGERFWHGAFFLNGQIATVLYFDDIEKGLLTVTPPKGETKFIRFTGQQHQGGRFEPSAN